MEDPRDAKISALEAKVRQLERDISERVRSFLLQNKYKHLPLLMSSQQVQTDTASLPPSQSTLADHDSTTVSPAETDRPTGSQA
jgi:hypothetical protein